MKKDLEYIDSTLRGILKNHSGILKFTSDDGTKCEATGTKEVMQGKQKVAGHYFASVIPKPKDIRFYYFPLYTHESDVRPLMIPELEKFLKGKTCFHIKGLNQELIGSLEAMVDKGVDMYKKDGLI